MGGKSSLCSFVQKLFKSLNEAPLDLNNRQCSTWSFELISGKMEDTVQTREIFRSVVVHNTVKPYHWNSAIYLEDWQKHRRYTGSSERVDWQRDNRVGFVTLSSAVNRVSLTVQHQLHQLILVPTAALCVRALAVCNHPPTPAPLHIQEELITNYVRSLVQMVVSDGPSVWTSPPTSTSDPDGHVTPGNMDSEAHTTPRMELGDMWGVWGAHKEAARGVRAGRVWSVLDGCL